MSALKSESDTLAKDTFTVESKNSNNNDGSNDNSIPGALVLLTVPLAWGTFAPVVKYMYEIDPPIPGFVFSAGYYIVAALSLNLLNSIQQQQSVDSSAGDSDDQSNTFSLPIQGGIELGSYLFLGNCLQVIGLESIPADRAAFEIQLTTVIVPFLQGIIGSSFGGVTKKTWAATMLAFAGVLTMGMESNSDATSSIETVTSGGSLMDTSLALQSGDALIFMAALAYSFHVIRLGKYAPTTSAVSLAAAKASTEAFLSIILVFGLAVFGNNISFGTEITKFFDAFNNGAMGSSEFVIPATVSILFTGLVTCAYTIFAQSYGQRTVSPSNANLIYSSQPLFSSIFAYVLIGEVLGPYGWIGGSLIAGAVLLITSQDKESIVDQ